MTERIGHDHIIRTAAVFACALSVPLAVPTRAVAHSPILACYDEGDGSVTCEAGYSDGAPSAGQTVRVLTQSRRLIVEAKFDRSNSYSFRKPDVPFIVEFEGDPSHLATFDGEDLK